MEAANNSRYKKTTNPFEEGDDVDDDTFLRNSRRPPPPPAPLQSAYGEIQSLQERRKEIEDRTLQSTESSIRILRESERIGIETGEELMRQREQLERTDERLDEINATLRFSQKHINGIKSVFSSLKNFVSGKKDVASPTSVPSSDSSKISTSNLEQKVSSYDRYENHPATRLRSGGEEAKEEEASGSKNISAKLEANLQEMSTTVSILKELATGLSYEIDSQNDLIGGITDKAEQADATIQKQNKDVQKLLRK